MKDAILRISDEVSFVAESIETMTTIGGKQLKDIAFGGAASILQTASNDLWELYEKLDKTGQESGFSGEFIARPSAVYAGE